MKELPIILKKLRESRDLTIEELAKKAGIGKGTVGDIETGRNKSTVKTLNKIAQALELSLDEKIQLEEAFLGRKTKKGDYILTQMKEPIKMIIIPVYSSVAAGIGYIPEAEPIDYITIPELSGECVGIKVNGDSMEPTFYSGDIVVLKKEVEVLIGEIGIFQNRATGEALVKRLKKKNGIYVLESDNHIFSDIEIKNDDLVCCGKVINVVKKNLKKRTNPLLEKIESLDPKQQKIIELMITGLLDKK